MKSVSSCLWLVDDLVCCDWLAVFGAAWFLYIPVSKASVPAVSCHGFMQGLDDPFPDSLVIQLHSWLLVHSVTQTHTYTHKQTHSFILVIVFFLQTYIYSLTHYFIHPFAIHPIQSSNNLTGSHQFSSETNKCVTCH